ncbi:MAG: PQQ-dependent sugar dehydrogenase [Rubricoccaceae bacterium]|nr:PQQ-dependent sugar dehydrogenase [Rubricoccaceae bacterium]
MPPTAHAQASESLTEAFPSLSPFNEPLDVAFDPTDDNRLYVAEQGGLVYDFEGSDTPRVVLDLTEKVFDADGEGGFQSLAFPPDFKTSRNMYVHYIAGDDSDPDGTRRSVVSRFDMLESGIVDPESEENIIEIGQPSHFHNGGRILFGPNGYLYVPLGDGGINSFGNAQDRTTLLGSILRIDPQSPSGDLNYGIPADNPFVGNTEGWREEIWAWGMRNPWRSSFDSDGNFWVGDVGNILWEEIDIVEAGKNYGWADYEGFECREEPCKPDDDLRFPVHAYPHNEATGGFAVIGGVVYEGDHHPSYTGWYFFADAWTNRIWALNPANPEEADLLVDVGIGAPRIVDFAQDSSGRILVVGYLSGLIYDVEASFPVANEPVNEPGLASDLEVRMYPNPTRASSTIQVSSRVGGVVGASVLDVLGRRIASVFEDVLGAHQRRRYHLDTGGLAAGTYLLRVETATAVDTQRFVVIQ